MKNGYFEKKKGGGGEVIIEEKMKLGSKKGVNILILLPSLLSNYTRITVKKVCKDGQKMKKKKSGGGQKDFSGDNLYPVMSYNV